MNAAPGREEAWQALEDEACALADVSLRDLFAADPDRARRYVRTACGLRLDLSRQRVRDETLARLLELASACDVEGWRDRTLSGERVNTTEGRAVLHTALRNRSDRAVLLDGKDVMPDVRANLARIRVFVAAVQDGTRAGATGERFERVLHLGIGGSHLGPAMAAAALAPWARPDLVLRFVSNVDAGALDAELAAADPARTLLVVASKTFTTLETMTNARTARAWLVDALGDAAVARHCVAVTSAGERARAFGVAEDAVFPLPEWVGGRTSLWSSVGLSLALSIGPAAFEEMLAGAFEMDEHFRATPLAENLPALMALLGVWNATVLGAGHHAVLPYDWALRLLPAHLQQLEMESNGKRVARDGCTSPRTTVPLVWGGPGLDGQHAYYQWLHQGTWPCSVDLLVPLDTSPDRPGHRDAVLASALAQAEALMRGRTEGEARAELEARGESPDEARALAPHLVLAGNRPSSMLGHPRLDPRTFGALVALYEHKVLVQAALWGTNAFDQWGVELGKAMAARILARLAGGPAAADEDPSTAAWLRHLAERS